MTWDPLQRAVLLELGHDLYRLAEAEPDPGALEGGVEVASAVAETAGSPPEAGLDRAMLARLARAAGLDAAALAARDAGVAALSAGLRANPEAKRALWPRLRALRRVAR